MLDKVILLIIAIGVAIGMYHGFFREAVSTIGVVVAAIAANSVVPYGTPYVRTWIESPQLASLTLWLVTFLLVMFVLSRLAALLEKVMQAICLGWISRLAGGLFGGIKVCLVSAIVVSLLELLCAHVEGLALQPYLEQSHLTGYLHQLLGVIAPIVTELIG